MKITKLLLTGTTLLTISLAFLAPGNAASTPPPPECTNDEGAVDAVPDSDALDAASYYAIREIALARAYLWTTGVYGSLNSYARSILREYCGLQRDLTGGAVDARTCSRHISAPDLGDLSREDRGIANEIMLNTGDIDFIYASTEMDAHSEFANILAARALSADSADEAILVRETALAQRNYERARGINRALCDSDPVMAYYTCHYN